MYPNMKYRTNRFVHFFYEIFLHFLPAYLYDFVLRYKGMKPIMFKIAKRYKVAADTGEFFARHEYNFEVKNVKELLHEISNADDGEEFMCDVKQLDWDEYLKNYVCGIRKHILKDDDTTMERARRTLKRSVFYRGKKLVNKSGKLFLVSIHSQIVHAENNHTNNIVWRNRIHSLQNILLMQIEIFSYYFSNSYFII